MHLSRKISAAFVIITRLNILPISCAAEIPPFAGPFSNFRNFQFEGNESFSTSTLQRALTNDIGLIPHARPGRSLSELMSKVDAALVAGYVNSGFPEANVRTRWDSALAKPVVTVFEGPRFRRGQVVVTGATPEIEASILKWLTTRVPPLDAVAGGRLEDAPGRQTMWRNKDGKLVDLEPAKWKTGNDCSFYLPVLEEFRPYIERAVQDQGFRDARFDLALRQNPEKQTADLHIDVTRIGEQWTIDEIIVEGAEHHTPEQITQFLSVAQGDVVTADLLLRLQQKLQDSGRFRWSNVYVDAKLIPTAPTRLTIDVLEGKELPLLGDALSENQQIALRAAEWVNHFSQQEEDLSISVAGISETFYPEKTNWWKVHRLQFCFSPKNEMLLRVDYEDRFLGKDESFVLRWTKQQGEIAFLERKLSYRFSLKGTSFPNWSMTLQGQPPQSKSDVQLFFGLGMASEPKANVMAITPFAALNNLGRFGGTIDRQGNELVLKGGTGTARIDVETGRLISLSMQQEDGAKPALVFDVQTSAGLLKDIIEQIDSQVSSETARIHTSGEAFEFITALLESCAGEGSPTQHTILAYANLIQRQLPEWTNKTEDRQSFNIPLDPAVPPGNWGILAVALGYSQTLLSPDCQPNRFAKEFIAFSQMRDAAAQFELSRIIDDRSNGPILSWLYAEVFARIHPPAAQRLASHGLNHLDEQHVQHDLQNLLMAESVMSSISKKIVAVVRSTPAEELHELFPQSSQGQIDRIREMQNDKLISDEQFILHVAMRLWEFSGIQEHLRLRLEVLRQDPEASAIKQAGGTN